MCVCECTRGPFKSQFSPFTMWLPGLNSGHQCWQQAPLSAALFSQPYILMQEFSLNLQLSDWLDQLHSELSGSILRAGITGMCRHDWIFLCMCWGFELRLVRFEGKCSFLLSSLPSLMPSYFIVSSGRLNHDLVLSGQALYILNCAPCLF